MVKVDRQSDKYDIKKAWTYAKRFHCDHPKGEFKQEGLHFFPKCNDVHWYLIIVDFDQKIIFSVDSYGNVDHERDATAMLTFFWLALLKKRAATRHSSRRDTFMLRGNFDVLEWEYRRLLVPLACRQTDSISCGLFTCMNIREIVQERDILMAGGSKQMRRSQVNQEKAPLWRLYFFFIIVMESK
jgi:Ulp1 family protease